jgi:hypothetical protein
LHLHDADHVLSGQHSDSESPASLIWIFLTTDELRR